jgi:hypothetical protein
MLAPGVSNALVQIKKSLFAAPAARFFFFRKISALLPSLLPSSCGYAEKFPI